MPVDLEKAVLDMGRALGNERAENARLRESEVRIRRDQTSRIVEWLRSGPQHDHNRFDFMYADMIEREFASGPSTRKDGPA